MPTNSADWKVYLVEQALRKMNYSRVSTMRLADEVLFTIDFRWQLVVDEDELDKLYDAVDSGKVFKDVFDKLAETNLRLNSLKS